MTTQAVYRSDLSKEERELIDFITLRVKKTFLDGVESCFEKNKFDIVLMQRIMIASIMDTLGIGLTIICSQLNKPPKEEVEEIVEEITNTVIHTMSHKVNQKHQLNRIMENCLGK